MLQMILVMAIGGVVALGIAIIALEWRVLAGFFRLKASRDGGPDVR